MSIGTGGLEEQSGPPDARLVPAALTVWFGTAAGLLFAWWCTVLLGLLAAGIGCWSLCRRAWARAPAAALLCCGLLTAGVLGAETYGVAANPLRGFAAEHASARLRVELTDRPKPLYSTGFGGRQAGVRSVLVHAKAVAAEVHGRAVPADADVLLFAPAESWRGLLIGQRVTAHGSLAPADRPDTTVAVQRVRGPPGQPGAPGFGQRSVEAPRAGLRQVAGALGSPESGLLPGIVDGDTSGIPHELTKDLRTVGLTHLTAVSGEHLAIICGAVLLLLRAIRVGPRLSATLTGLALLGFVLLVGPAPSVLRAGVMAAVALLAMAIGRQRAALPALAFAVIVLVSCSPSLAVNLGFTLSVAATAGLVLLATRWASRLRARGVPLGIAQVLAVPVAAHLATAPVLAGFTGKVSVVAILANVLATPVFAPATLFGVLAALTAPILPWLATGLAYLAWPELHWIVLVTRTGARLPGAEFSWPSGWLGAVLLAGLIGCLGLALRYRRGRVLVLAGLLILVTVTVPPKLLHPGWPPHRWAMVSCDVGQGDAAVLATGKPGSAVVVDTGPDDRAVAECLDRLGVREVPAVLLSHMHADHIGGLRAVLGRAVGAVVLGEVEEHGWAPRLVRAEAAAAHVPVRTVPTGAWLDWPGLRIKVLGPLPAETEPSGDSGTEINNTSLVLRAETAAGRVLLTGDVEDEAQADLLGSGADLRATVLKIPHHGSRSQDPEFLDAIRASIAIASVGAGNDYGHPNRGTMNRLRSDGAMTLRTDRDGDVAVVAGAGDRAGPEVVRRGAPRPAPD